MTIVNILSANKKILLKAISLMLGYQLWLSVSSSLLISHTVTIPVCIYNQQEKQIIDIPESIKITLHGARRLLSLVNYNDVCAHIDGAALNTGTHYITLSAHHLLLPQEITITHYTPLRVIVTLA